MKRPLSTIDLHSHSTASDGTLGPAALVAAAAAAGVTVLALTDHDSTAGLDAAQAAAAAHGMRLVPGVEISVSWERHTLHVLGLGIDPQAPALQRGLARLQAQRETRAEQIAARLDKAGLPDALARARALAGAGQVTRTHFARALVAAGLSKNLKKAFQRHLSAGKPAYVKTAWADLGEALDWIRAAGGEAVLAHPARYDLGPATRSRLLEAFRQAGGTGMEVSCGSSEPAEVEQLAAEAQAHGLLGSLGSDFHDPAQHWLGLGRLHPLPATLPPVWSRWGL